MAKIDIYDLMKRGDLVNEIAGKVARGQGYVYPVRYWQEQIRYLCDSAGRDDHDYRHAAEEVAKIAAKMSEIGRGLEFIRGAGGPAGTIERLRQHYETRLAQLAESLEAWGGCLLAKAPKHRVPPPLRRRSAC